MSGLDRLSVLAHEVRSPVAALVAIAEAYRAADEARRARLRELATAAVGSIERLLLDASTASIVPERLDAAVLLRDAAERAGLRGHPVTVSAGNDLTLDGDPERLLQALDNLIGNAVGHSPPDGLVTVSGRHEAGSVVLAVTDQGEGVEPGDLVRIFEPGVRLTAARTGSGLGLAVVRAIARAHGGEVEVESSPGQGSTFRLVLPGASAAD